MTYDRHLDASLAASPFVVVITGGRDFTDRATVFAALDAVHGARPITTLISGMAKGADSLAVEWAKARKVPGRGFPAKWDVDGRAAGPLRNQRMIDKARPDFCVAFPGGTGTADMVTRCDKAGVEVSRVTIRKLRGNA